MHWHGQISGGFPVDVPNATQAYDPIMIRDRVRRREATSMGSANFVEASYDHKITIN
jgi:hypothetical protein